MGNRLLLGLLQRAFLVVLVIAGQAGGDEAVGGGDVELLRWLRGSGFDFLDLLEVLSHAREFGEDGVFFGLDAVEGEVGWSNQSALDLRQVWSSALQKSIDSMA